MEEKMKLWNEVYESNPEEVKKMDNGLHSIDAYAQIKKATEMWGPYGLRRGFTNVEYSTVENMVLFKGTFTYPDGEFPIINNKNIGDNCMKYIYTDSLTKALSMLGFNADVYMGKFVDKDDGKKQEDLNGFSA